MTSDSGKQRLRPWLTNILDNNKVKGVQWLDKDRTKFKIPWKHGGKQDFNPDDAQIFKEWAMHTGKFRPGIDQTDFATWKTRLRCAFNKAPDIQEVKEESKLDHLEPYRVYRFIAKTKAPSRPSVQKRQEATQAINSPDIMETYTPSPEGAVGGMCGGAVPTTVEEFKSSDSMKLPSLGDLKSADLLPKFDSSDLMNMMADSLPSKQEFELRAEGEEEGMDTTDGIEYQVKTPLDYPLSPPETCNHGNAEGASVLPPATSQPAPIGLPMGEATRFSIPQPCPGNYENTQFLPDERNQGWDFPQHNQY